MNLCPAVYQVLKQATSYSNERIL